MITRRNLIKLSGAAALAGLMPGNISRLTTREASTFRFCLNTSTISRQKPGLLRSIEIAAEAGYDGVELWTRDVDEWLKQGNSISKLADFLREHRLRVENGISFTEWLVEDERRRVEALSLMEKEMEWLAALKCSFIAAPPAGLSSTDTLDLTKAAIRYRETLRLGRKHGVMPLLEFWGASGTLSNFGQALAIAAMADDADARILPDVYHLFRGGSGFNALNLVNGKLIQLIHMNDYPGHKPITSLTDADRVYPGDGVAPFHNILSSLKAMGGTKVLSLELFNRDYWKQDALDVAKTGLAKMKKLVDAIA